MEYTIYKIICKDENIKDCYVGSTKDLHRRKSNHKYSCNTKINKDHNLPLYIFIRNNGGWDNFIFDIVETFICNKIQILEYERQFIEKLNSTLNSWCPFRNKNEVIYCECGSIYSRRKVSRHEKCKKHQDYLLSLSSGL
jgi:group I intron endonuclease